MALTPNSPNADNSMQALKQYGSYIVTAILLALAAYFGWTYWQNNHAHFCMFEVWPCLFPIV